MKLTFCVNFLVVGEGGDWGKSLGGRGIKFLRKIYFLVGGYVLIATGRELADFDTNVPRPQVAGLTGKEK